MTDRHIGRGPFEDYLGRKWCDAVFPRTPSSVGAASVWVDASASSTLTLAGGRVTDWQNRGYCGGRFSNRAYPDSRPALVDDAINGLAAVRFDGGDALVQNTLTWPEGGAPYQYTMLAVIVPPSTMSFSGQYLFRANKSNNHANVFEILLAPNALPNGQVVYHHRWPAGDANLDAINVEAAFTGPLLVKVGRSSDGAYGMLAGAATATQTGGPNRNIPAGEQLTWLLGGEAIAAPGDLAVQGGIAELMVLTTALDDRDEPALLGMLRETWGLSASTSAVTPDGDSPHWRVAAGVTGCGVRCRHGGAAVRIGSGPPCTTST